MWHTVFFQYLTKYQDFCIFTTSLSYIYGDLVKNFFGKKSKQILGYVRPRHLSPSVGHQVDVVLQQGCHVLVQQGQLTVVVLVWWSHWGWPAPPTTHWANSLAKSPTCCNTLEAASQVLCTCGGWPSNLCLPSIPYHMYLCLDQICRRCHQLANATRHYSCHYFLPN